MFWKFFLSVLLLPSCLEFDIAAASVNSKVQTLAKYEELGNPGQQKQVNQNLLEENFSTQATQQPDSKQLVHIVSDHPYLIAHWYNHDRNCRHRRSYDYRYYYPESLNYRHYYYPESWNYRHYYYPGYYHHHYYRHDYDYPRYDYYRHEHRY
jgi:hypothetical protein